MAARPVSPLVNEPSTGLTPDIVTTAASQAQDRHSSWQPCSSKSSKAQLMKHPSIARHTARQIQVGKRLESMLKIQIFCRVIILRGVYYWVYLQTAITMKVVFDSNRAFKATYGFVNLRHF